MGYNTTVLILNDALSTIRDNPVEFTNKVVDACHKFTEFPTTIGVGNHANPVEVMPTQHADIFRLYFTHCNSIVELSKHSKDTKNMMQREHSRKFLLERIKMASAELRDLKKEIDKIDKESK